MGSEKSDLPIVQMPEEVIDQMIAESAEPKPGIVVVRSKLLNDPDNPNQPVRSDVSYEKTDRYYHMQKEPKE